MGQLELACPTAFACLYKVRPGVLTLSLHTLSAQEGDTKLSIENSVCFKG